jgi:hypothetical protein
MNYLNEIKGIIKCLSWGLGIGDWAQSPIPNPQSPIPNPQSPKIIKKTQFNYKITIKIIFIIY